jgi:hypothetical protein
VHYRDPETLKRYRFVTTLPESINPGTIAMLYYKRWTVEKAYNNSKSNLKEKKAWSSYDTCHARHRMGTSRRGTRSSCLCKILTRLNHFNSTLTAYWLAPIVLNIWSCLRLPDVYYPVVDPPCRSGTCTRWNYRPCSAAHPFYSIYYPIYLII